MLTHLSSIRSDPIGFLIELMYLIPSMLVALTLHELAHGYVALRCGDHTAEMMGRLSFNPLRHLDPLGTLSMLLIGIGWAKPVPVNPRNYRNFKRDDLLVSVAGIATNLCLFILGTLLSLVCIRIMCSDEILEFMPQIQQKYRTYLSADYGKNMSFMIKEFLKHLEMSPSRFLAWVSIYNGRSLESYLMYYPISHAWLVYVLRFLGTFCSLNIGLAVFNLLPFPPLDGYRLANNLIFRGRWRLTPQIMRVSVVLLLVLNYATGWICIVIESIASGAQTALLWAFLPIFGMA